MQKPSHPAPRSRCRPPLHLLALAAGLAGCLTTVAPPEQVGYQNPLGLDGGLGAPDGGQVDAGGGSSSEGQVGGRQLDLTAAVYLVSPPDGGQPRTEITLGDVAGLCPFVQGDGGTAASFDLLRIRLDGDVPGSYPVSLALGPSGAVAALQYQSDAGAFGSTRAVSGIVELQAVDPGNRQVAQGLYSVTFSASETLSGRFLAAPCAGLSPAGG